jgi:hypothetical protein
MRSDVVPTWIAPGSVKFSVEVRDLTNWLERTG